MSAISDSRSVIFRIVNGTLPIPLFLPFFTNMSECERRPDYKDKGNNSQDSKDSDRVYLYRRLYFNPWNPL